MSRRLYDIIEERAGAIISRFVDGVREREVEPHPLPNEQIIDHLNHYLGELCTALRRDFVGLDEACFTAAQHGHQRWNLGFDLKSTILEYGVLRDAILSAVEEAEYPITIPEYRNLGQFLNIGVANAAVEFAERVKEQVDGALRQAENAIKAREEVLAIVSHDLKNPLQVIVGNCSLLAHELGNDELNSRRDSFSKKVDAIYRSSGRMTTLISDILDLARMRAGELKIDMAEQSVDELVRLAEEHAMPSAEQHGVVLRVEPPNDGVIHCSRERVLQILANLIGNAIKFSPEAGVVSVRAHCTSDMCTFAVEDHGPGIPNDRIPYLFNRFWQAPETASQGTGLGLAIAKDLVDAHGGRIWVESEVGKGSTFFVGLPTRPDRSVPDRVRSS